jgi:hypothetical protein
MSDWQSLSSFAKVREPIDLVAVNRIAPGFTVYKTGKSDGVATSPGYRTGDYLLFDASNTSKRFQMKNAWFLLGGTIIWEGADLDDSMGAKLIAPATVGVNSAGDFNKYALGGGANMYVPAAPGAGAWTLDLAAVHTSTSVLKCCPVPSTTNTGYFDYDVDTNVLTVNTGATGGYNLFDFELTMMHLAYGIWGKKYDGAETSLDVTEVVGKTLLPNWIVQIDLTTVKVSGIKVGVLMTTAVRGNT